MLVGLDVGLTLTDVGTDVGLICFGCLAVGTDVGTGVGMLVGSAGVGTGVPENTAKERPLESAEALEQCMVADAGCALESAKALASLLASLWALVSALVQASAL